MPPWEPRGDKIFCKTHNEEFPRGRVCPFTGCSDGEQSPDQVSVLDASDLPSVVDHERWFVGLSEELAGIGRVDSGESGPSVNERVKAFDGAIKARRAAVELAKYREDWINVERLETAVKELRARRDPARAVSAPGPVRH